MFKRRMFQAQDRGLLLNSCKQCLNNGELTELKRIEARIASDMKRDIERVRGIFQRHDAWAESDVRDAWPERSTPATDDESAGA